MAEARDLGVELIFMIQMVWDWTQVLQDPAILMHDGEWSDASIDPEFMPWDGADSEASYDPEEDPELFVGFWDIWGNATEVD